MPVGKPFPPGQSGNPTGRPAGLKEMRALIRERGKLIILNLLEEVTGIPSKGKAPGPKRVEAARVLLAYGYGLPNQPISGPSDDEGNATELKLDLGDLVNDLKRIAGENQAPPDDEDTLAPVPAEARAPADSSSSAASNEGEKQELKVP